MPGISRILVPVDFSPCSHAALEYAAMVAKRFGASIDVLHVWEPIGPEAIVHVSGETAQPLAHSARSSAGKEMEEFLGRVERRGVLIRGRLESGDPAGVILRIAASDRYDVITMATHGRTGLSHLFMGSVAEKVVQRAPCPVLTIRVPEEEQPKAGVAT